MKRCKKITALFLLLFLLVGMAACGKKAQEGGEEKTSSTQHKKSNVAANQSDTDSDGNLGTDLDTNPDTALSDNLSTDLNTDPSTESGMEIAVDLVEIKIGDYLRMGEYYDEPILWRCVDIDENGPLMLSDKILCLKPFDATGNNTEGSHGRGEKDGHYRQGSGSNYWGDSNIRDWLNSIASAGNVNWSCGNPPDSKHISFNAYDQEAGFLTHFSENEQSAMKTVTQKQLLDWHEYSSSGNVDYHRNDSDISNVLQNYDTAYSENTTDTVFLLDVKQIYRVWENRMTLGEDYYIGEPTQACVDHSEYEGEDLTAGEKLSTLLRSPDAYSENGSSVRFVSSSGEVGSYLNSANTIDVGVRPAFYLDLSSLRSTGSGTESDPFKLQ